MTDGASLDDTGLMGGRQKFLLKKKGKFVVCEISYSSAQHKMESYCNAFN